MRLTTTTQLETTVNTQRSDGWMSRIVRRLWPEPDRWEPVAKGLATIDGLRYEIKSVRIEGTYVKERNQHGQERYIITEPDGTTYTQDASRVSQTNTGATRVT